LKSSEANNSFKVFKDDYLFTKRGYINRWRYKNGKHRAKGYSDHLPVFAYFDIKPYKKDASQTSSKKIKKKRIEYLYGIETLDAQVRVNDVVVVMKRGRNAVVKQTVQGRGVFLYGCAGKLKEGHKYDILIDDIKTYKGLKEVTSAYKVKEKGIVDVKSYLSQGSDLSRLKQNEVIINLKGIYKNRYFYIGNKKLPIYFKKKNITPKNGTKLKIHYAHLGYYKREQLVIYRKKDFEILE